MNIQRRTFLRGAGACISLPFLESVAPREALAAAAATAPTRLAFVYHPNGCIMDQWRPAGQGRDFQLGATLGPLEPFRNELQVLTGFKHANATAGKDGAGDHARALATFLTGARARKTGGSDIQLGISVDQIAAQHIGQQTRFESLELSCDGSRKSGTCDSGYSCAYQFNISWRNENSPVSPESNPRLVFERLFAHNNKEAYLQRLHEQRSILDFVTQDARRLESRLGRNDKRKLGEYLDAIRAIERRIEKSEHLEFRLAPDYPEPEGIPESYQQHIQVMCDLIALAFESDVTRVATFMLAHDGSNRSFSEIGVPEGHHHISHHKNDPEKIEKLAKIDKFYVEQFAYLLEKLRAKKERNGRSILDNSMIVYGSGISDGNAHRHDDLPVLLAGRGGELNAGRHVDLPEAVPMSNLYVTLLNRLGVNVTDFGDSTGAFADV